MNIGRLIKMLRREPPPPTIGEAIHILAGAVVRRSWRRGLVRIVVAPDVLIALIGEHARSSALNEGPYREHNYGLPAMKLSTLAGIVEIVAEVTP